MFKESSKNDVTGLEMGKKDFVSTVYFKIF